MATQSTLTMVLDIDSTLIGDLLDKETGRDEITKELGEDFAQAYTLEVIGYPFPLYIGVPELLRALWQQNVRIAFFSSGTQKRNDLVVPALLQHAFGEQADTVKEQVAIYSRHHCIDTDKLTKEQKEQVQPEFSDTFHGWLKKDLRTIYSDPHLLRNTALMDDGASYMYRGQEKNFLYVNGNYGHVMERERIAIKQGEEPEQLDDLRCCFYHIFYGYGVFQRAVRLMQQETGLYLDDALYRVQVEQENATFDKGFYYPGKKRFALYQEGLQALQVINPQLDFVRP
ncbi:MAG: hypothetical protein AAF320_06745 [Myxococcota bacterium]